MYTLNSELLERKQPDTAPLNFVSFACLVALPLHLSGCEGVEKGSYAKSFRAQRKSTGMCSPLKAPRRSKWILCCGQNEGSFWDAVSSEVPADWHGTPQLAKGHCSRRGAILTGWIHLPLSLVVHQ